MFGAGGELCFVCFDIHRFFVRVCGMFGMGWGGVDHRGWGMGCGIVDGEGTTCRVVMIARAP
jgi:hypothetical protein